VTSTPRKETRAYDSPIRRKRSAETRERIIEAGSELVHELSSWEFDGVTIRAVAARAGVHERTVHRHFATERDLQGAILQRLVEESGVTIEGMRLEDIPGHVEQLFDYLASFSTTSVHEPDAALVALDERRKAAIVATVAADSPGLSDDQQRLAAAMIDALWSLSTYRRLTQDWAMDPKTATQGINWLIGLVSDAVREGRGPS
jgi:AcrR family transcriptional regulator